jgi:transcriptional regulator
MYTPPLFREDDPAVIRRMIRDAPFATLVTATAQGLMGTPLPLFFADEEQQSVLYGHVARANPQCKLPPTGEALAIFSGPNAYVTPSWYESKRAHGKVVPTWNYLAVHAYGQVEFFEDAVRLLDVVRKLTDLHEAPRAAPWAVSDAPDDFIAAQLKGIVGVRLVQPDPGDRGAECLRAAAGLAARACGGGGGGLRGVGCGADRGGGGGVRRLSAAVPWFGEAMRWLGWRSCWSMAACGSGRRHGAARRCAVRGRGGSAGEGAGDLPGADLGQSACLSGYGGADGSAK